MQGLIFPRHVEACPAAKPQCTLSERYRAALVIDGDTLSAVFEPWRAFDSPGRRRQFEAPRRAKFAAFADYYRRWSAMHPADLGGHAVLGGVYTRLGQADSARASLARASELAMLVGGSRNRFLLHLALAELQSGHPNRAAVFADSITTFQNVFGRFGRVPAGADTTAAARGVLVRPMTAGVVASDFERNLALFVAADANVNRKQLFNTLAFHSLGQRPATDTGATFALYRFQAFLALGDTVRARRALDEFDGWGRARANDYWDGYEMFAAESYLELGDTTAAWDRIAPFASRFAGFDLDIALVPMLDAPAGPHAGTIIGRTWLLYADLAAATGRSAEARRGYQMVVGLWEKGDAVVQPLVTRAKQALRN
jgi:hypothetical protein